MIGYSYLLPDMVCLRQLCSLSAELLSLSYQKGSETTLTQYLRLFSFRFPFEDEQGQTCLIGRVWNPPD